MIRTASFVLRTLTLALLGLFVAAPARAQTVCDGGTLCNGCPTAEQVVHCVFPSEVPVNNEVRTCMSPAFDPTLGRLLGVKLNASVAGSDARFQFENEAPVACPGNSSPSAWIIRAQPFLFDPSHPFDPMNPTGDFCNTVAECSGPIPPLDAFDGTIDFCDSPAGSCTTICQCGSGYTANCTPGCNPQNPCLCGPICLTDHASLAAYMGPGPLTFTMFIPVTQIENSNCGKGAATFRIRVQADVTITYIYCPNAPPIANDDTATVCKGASVDIPVLANDCDPANCAGGVGGSINCGSLMLVTQPMHGVATISGCSGISPLLGCPQSSNCPGCVVHYTPDPSYVGPDSFTYKVADNQGVFTVNPATVSITVCVVNAVDDAATVCSGASVQIPVLANDSTTCGALDCASLMIVTAPLHGAVSVIGCTGTGSCPNCVVRYTPNAGYTGPDSFTYKVSNDQAPACTGQATVNLTVCSVTASNESANVCGGASVDIPIHASTTCGQIACSTLMVVTPPMHGIATQIGSTCAFHYVPAPGYSGPDSFTYKVSNDQTPTCMGQGLVSINVCTVNAVDDTGITVCNTAGSSVNIPVLANDSTSCGLLDCSSLMIVTPPAHGSAMIVGCTGTGACAGCVVKYTPTIGYTGPDAFTYKVSNNLTPACMGMASVSITVCGVNAQPDSATVCAGSSVDIPVLANDSPTCGNINCATLTITTRPAHGIATVQGCTGTGACAGCVVHYTPTPGYVGADSFAYRVANDQTPACTGMATVSITVCAVNAMSDSATVCSGSSVDIPVLANDSTSCGALDCSSLMIVTPTAHGSLSIIGCTGTGNCAGCVVHYTSTPGYTGADAFTYKVSNNQNPACTGQATVNINVCSVTASNENASVCSGASVDIPVHATTSCGQIDCSTLMIVTPPAHATVTQVGSTCAFHYVPTPGFTGPDSFTYKVSNNQNPACTGQGTVTVTVCGVNAVNDSGFSVCSGSMVTIPVLANDSTTCGALDCGSLMIVTPPAHGTATPVGCTGTGACTGCVIAYTAAAGYTGPDSFTYKVSNNLTPPCTGMATVTLNVCAVNASNDVATVCSGSSVNIPVLANDSTTCGSLNCASLTITTPPANGTAMVVGCTGTGACAGCSVKYTPNAGFVGSDSFAYRVANDQSPACVGQATVNVTVCAVTATNANATVCAGSSVDVPIHATTSCGQIDCSTLMVVTPPQHGTATPNGATCSFHYIAAPGYAGPDSFTFKISNGQSRACSGQGTVNVTINAAPTVVGDKAVRDPNSAVAITIHVLDNDLPGAGCSFDFNSLMITNQTGLCGNAVVDHVNGTVVYTPTVTPCAQIDSFDYTVCNTCGCCGSAHVEINTSCFERNRRQCASLLLYPEFDNSTAAKTLITVTMGCCEPTVGSTLVEFRFINKNNCQETNTTFTLTPCDTLTFLSSAVNPNQQHGYLYAYAKNATPSPNNPTGTPIVFNHLIGDELIIDGIQVLDYGMNAVAFKGYGADGMDVADGTPNDDDGDGIRDLNGPDAPNPEYDEAPDRILIPRFLGQDVPGGTTYANSKIILINLSGGSAFTTTLSIEGFNDNEVAFSDQFTFYCWAKPDLRDFSAFTLQSFLVNSGSDPAGTLGLAEETGWLNLDGLDASSSQESIHDPAFYAVLIEQLNGSFGADLPWEFCSQTNGSLLSTSLLGDGDPTPTNGDNQ